MVRSIIAMAVIMAMTAGLFEPMKPLPKVNAETLNKKEKQMAAEIEQAKEDTWNECKDERTVISTSYQRADGKKKAAFYSEAVRFWDAGTKKLVDYDAALKPNENKKSEQGTSLAGYSYENKAGDKKHYLPNRLGKHTPILTEYQNYRMSLVPLSQDGKVIGTDPAAVQEETVEDLYGDAQKAITGVTYQSEEGIRYRYDSQNNGIQETIWLDGPVASHEFSFLFRLKNAYAQVAGAKEKTEKSTAAPDGQEENAGHGNASNEQNDISDEATVLSQGNEIVVFNDNNQTVGLLPPVFCNDNSREAYREGGYYTLDLIREKTKGTDRYRTYRLTVRVDAAYLQSEQRVYPVQISPSFIWSETSNETDYDTYVREGEPYQTANYFDSDAMAVGYYDGDCVRSYLKFADLETTLQGKYIEDAKLKLTEAAGSEAGAAIQCKRVISSWDPATLHYVNQPAWENTELASLTCKGVPGTVHQVNLTDYVKGLLQKNNPNEGLVCLSEEKENTQAAWFHTANANTAEARPSLVVTYYDAPAAPYASVSKSYLKKGENVTLIWSEATVPSLGHIEYRIAKYQERTGTETETIVPYSASTKIGAAESGSAVIPMSSLPEGSYKIVVRSVDSQGNPGVGKGVILHIDSTPPTLADASFSPGTISGAPSNEAPVLKWSGASDDHFDRIEYRVQNQDTGSEDPFTLVGTTTEGSTTLATGTLSSDGTNTILVRAVDRAGNVSKETRLRYHYDKVAPDIKKVTLNDNSETNYAPKAAEVTYEVADAYLTEVSVRVNGGTYLKMGSTGTGTYRLPDSQFTDTNVYTLEVKATDQAGNTSCQAMPYYYSAWRETRQPSTPILKPAKLNLMTAASNEGELQQYLEEYRPKKLICREQWDGRTELSWSGIFYEIPFGIYYEVYRSTAKGFTPSDATLVDGYVTELYYVVKDNQPEQTYYYKVRAVMRDFSGNVTIGSSYSAEAAGTTLPAGETAKRLGTKWYLPYADFSVANADGRIEQTQGNVFLQMPSVSITSKELAIRVNPVYNSQSLVDYGMGPGWMLPYSMRISELSWDKILYQDETGANYVLTGSGTGTTYRSKENPDLTIVKGVNMINTRVGRIFYELKQKENITYRFNERGRIVSMQETNGDSLTFTYDSYHENLILITTGSQKSAVFTYYEEAPANGEVKLKSVVFPDGSTLLYNYTEGRLTEAVYQNNGKSMRIGKYEYRDAKMTKLFDGKNHAYEIGYAGVRATKILCPNRDATAVEYDTGAGQTTVVTENGGARQCSVTVSYDGEGRILSQKDAAGLKTEYQYGTQPNITYYITGETKEVVEQVVDAAGIVKTNMKKVVNTTAFDNNGNVTKEQDEQGNTTEYQYKYNGENTAYQPSNILEKEDNGNPISDEALHYDELGNETGSREKISNTESTSARTASYAGSIPIPQNEGEVVSILGLICNQETYEYDASGNLKEEREQSGSVETKVKHQYDIMGRITKTEEYRITVEQGNQNRTEKLNCTTSFEYDALGRQTGITKKWENVPGSKDEVETIQYDENGNVTKQTDSEGVITETTYDAMNRPVSTKITKNHLVQETTYEYSYENLTVYDGKGGSQAYAGALKTVTKNHTGRAIGFRYTNGLGQVVRSVTDGIYTDFTYDAMGRVTVTYVMGTAPRATGGKVTCQLYDTAGNVTKTLINPGRLKASDPIPEAGLYEMDISKYSRLYGFGTAVYDDKGLRATNTECAGFLIPLPKVLKEKERAEIRVYGIHTGQRGIRVFLSNDGSGPGNQRESIDVAAQSLPAVWTVTAARDIEKIAIKSLAGNNLEPATQITGISVKYLDDPTVPEKPPAPKPTAVPSSSGKPSYDAPAGYQEWDVSVFTADTDGSSITRYDEKGLYAKNANLYFPLIDEAYALPQGREVEAIIIGKKLGTSSFRTMLHKGTSGASDIFTYADNASGVTQKEYGFEWKCKFNTGWKAPGTPSDAVTANLLALKGPAGGKFDEIQIYRIFVKWDGMEIKETPEPTPKALHVDLTNPSRYSKVGGSATAVWDASESAVRVKTGGYGQGIVFQFTLPPGETLADYERLQYDLKFVSDQPVSWKRIRADVAAGLSISGISGTAADATFGSGTMYQESSTTGREWQTDQVIDTHDLFRSRHQNKTGEVYLALGLHVGDSSDNGGNAYLIKNVRLVRSGKPRYLITKDTIVTSTEYDSLGNVKSETDEMGVTTVYDYDAQKRVTEVRIINSQIKKGYDQKRTYHYDEVTNDGNILTRTIDDSGNQSTEKINTAGQVLEIADYNGSKKYATTFTYDTSGNVIKQKQPNGDYLEYEYDGKNQVKQKRGYRSNGVLESATKYEYNTAGNLTRMTDYTINGNTWVPLRIEMTGYDSLQRKNSYTVVDGTDQPTDAQCERAGILYEYDKENRLIQVTYPKQKGLKSLAFEYHDSNGWLMKVKGTVVGIGEQTVREYRYNAFGSVQTITDSLEYLSGGDRKLVKSYEYDTLERVVKMKYADSKKADSGSQPKGKESFAYEYDQKSQIVKETHENQWSDTVGEQFTKTTAYRYNRLGRLEESQEVFQKGTQASQTKQTTYEYDEAGNRTKQNENGVVSTYQYNGLYQLTESATDGDTLYYTYDDNGNQSSVSDGTYYTYDVENRLTDVNKMYDRYQTQSQKNTYNGRGQRIRKTSTSFDYGIYNQEDFRYFYEGSSVLYRTSGTNTGMNAADVVYLYGTSDNVMLAEEKNSAGQPAAYGYTKDIRGSTRDLIDSAGQTLVRYTYNDFGETTITGTGTVGNEILYTGGIYDKDTKQYYLNARYYDPEDGRFISQDSYRGEQTNPDTWNLYAYCNGNPVTCLRGYNSKKCFETVTNDYIVAF